jgi:hypothetical protein
MKACLLQLSFPNTKELDLTSSYFAFDHTIIFRYLSFCCVGGFLFPFSFSRCCLNSKIFAGSTGQYNCWFSCMG